MPYLRKGTARMFLYRVVETERGSNRFIPGERVGWFNGLSQPGDVIHALNMNGAGLTGVEVEKDQTGTLAAIRDNWSGPAGGILFGIKDNHGRLEAYYMTGENLEANAQDEGEYDNQ